MPLSDILKIVQNVCSTMMAISILFQPNLFPWLEDPFKYTSWSINIFMFSIGLASSERSSNYAVLGILAWIQTYFVSLFFIEPWFCILISALHGLGAGIAHNRSYVYPISCTLSSVLFGLLFAVYRDVVPYMMIPLSLLYISLVEYRKPLLMKRVDVYSDIIQVFLAIPLSHLSDVGFLSFALGICISIIGVRIKEGYVASGILSSVTSSTFFLIDSDASQAGWFAAWGVLVSIYVQQRGIRPGLALGVGIGWLFDRNWILSLILSAGILGFVTISQLMGNKSLSERCEDRIAEIRNEVRARERLLKKTRVEYDIMNKNAHESNGHLKQHYLIQCKLNLDHQRDICVSIRSLTLVKTKFERLKWLSNEADHVEDELQLVTELDSLLKASNKGKVETDVYMDSIYSDWNTFDEDAQEMELEVLEKRLDDLKNTNSALNPFDDNDVMYIL